MGQSVPKDGTGGKFRKESHQDKVNRAKFRMEQREGKLDQANRKLAKQKPLKPKGPVRSVLGTAGWGVHGYVHGKIYENEHENVGIEGGPPLRAGGGNRWPERGAVRQAEGAAAPRQGRTAGAIQIHQGHGGLSIPHGRPGAPGAAEKRVAAVLLQARLKQQYRKRAKEAAK